MHWQTFFQVLISLLLFHRGENVPCSVPSIRNGFIILSANRTFLPTSSIVEENEIVELYCFPSLERIGPARSLCLPEDGSFNPSIGQCRLPTNSTTKNEEDSPQNRIVTIVFTTTTFQQEETEELTDEIILSILVILLCLAIILLSIGFFTSCFIYPLICR